MVKLEPKEQLILDYIRETIRTRGYPPSIRDICTALEIKSTSTVHTCLDRLEKKGYIQRENGKSRSITLCGEEGGRGIPIVRFSKDRKEWSDTAETLPFVYSAALPSGARLVAYPLDDGRCAVVLCSDERSVEGTVALCQDGVVKLQDVDDAREGEFLGRALAVIEQL